MKTLRREGQYVVIFHRALWPERPYGIDFFKKSSEFGDSTFPKLSKNVKKNVRNGGPGTVFGNSRTRNDARRVRKVMEPLQTPKNPIKN